MFWCISLDIALPKNAANVVTLHRSVWLSGNTYMAPSYIPKCSKVWNQQSRLGNCWLQLDYPKSCLKRNQKRASTQNHNSKTGFHPEEWPAFVGPWPKTQTELVDSIDSAGLLAIIGLYPMFETHLLLHIKICNVSRLYPTFKDNTWPQLHSPGVTSISRRSWHASALSGTFFSRPPAGTLHQKIAILSGFT